MEENGYRFGVGVLVLASALIGVLLVVFFGAAPTFWVKRYRVIIQFPAAPGVEIDTPVRKNGVKVGRVAGVRLQPGDNGVYLDLELDSKIEIQQGETCRIGTGSLITGDGIVEFIQPTEAILVQRFDGKTGLPRNGMLEPEERTMAQTVMKEGDFLSGGQVAGDPMNLIIDMQSNFATTLQSIEKAAGRIDSLAASVQDVMGGSDDEIRDMVQRTRLALDNFNLTTESVRRVFDQMENSRVPEALAKILDKLPTLVDEAEQVVLQTKTTLKSFEEVGVNFQEVGKTANETVANIRDFTAPLRGEGGRVVQEAVNTLHNLDLLVTDLRQFSQRLNSGQGTIARLIEDDQLYYSLVNSLDNIERTTSRLQPIIEDVRVFTDKVARDPGQLGVRGALSGRPHGIGLK